MKETAYVQPLQTIYLKKKAGKRANAEPHALVLFLIGQKCNMFALIA